MSPSIPYGRCFYCGLVTAETQSVYGVGHQECYRRMLPPPGDLWRKYSFPKGRKNTIWKRSSLDYISPEKETWDEWLDRRAWEISDEVRISFNRGRIEQARIFSA